MLVFVFFSLSIYLIETGVCVNFFFYIYAWVLRGNDRRFLVVALDKMDGVFLVLFTIILREKLEGRFSVPNKNTRFFCVT